jgi:hypothetical protein
MYIINDTELAAYAGTYFRPLLGEKVILLDLKSTLPFYQAVNKQLKKRNN